MRYKKNMLHLIPAKTQTLLDQERAKEFNKELCEILFYQPLNTILGFHVAVILLLTYFYWNIIPQFNLLVWACSLIALSFVFIITTTIYRRTLPDKRNFKIWIYMFFAGGVTVGLGWASTTLWPHVMSETETIVFVLLVAIGIASAGIAVLAPFFLSYVLFAAFITQSFSIAFFIKGGQLYLYLGILVQLYFLVLLLSGFYMRQAVHQTIRLRIDKGMLIKELTDKNAEAEEARESAVKADKSKSKFLAAASHDLRQPLHALGLFVNSLESHERYSDVKEIVDNIRISTDALGDLFNSLLDISKLDAGLLQPNVSNIMLQPVFQRIRTDYSEMAREKGIELHVLDNGYITHSDPAMLERICRNLVFNAIRYTQKGRVVLGCRRRGNQIAMQVHDSGIGIPEQELQNIFEEFYQVKNPERDRKKGLGLGLAIVKRLTDLLGYKVNVKSVENKGSMFETLLPYISCVKSIETPPKTYVADVNNARVLVIDDEALIRKGTRQVIEGWGCEVREAETIEQAVEAVYGWQDVDLILTDFRLRQNTTGLDAIHAINQKAGRKIPAIILTGDTNPQRLSEAKQSGYKLLHKPVSPAKLRSLMSYVLEKG